MKYWIIYEARTGEIRTLGKFESIDEVKDGLKELALNGPVTMERVHVLADLNMEIHTAFTFNRDVISKVIRDEC